MKFLVTILAVQIALCVAQQYTSRYDTIDVDMILSNKRVLKNYVRCILDEGPCTAEGRELRNHIPDAVKTNCTKCTDAQKSFVRKGVQFLMEHNPEDWKKITTKFNIKWQI